MLKSTEKIQQAVASIGTAQPSSASEAALLAAIPAIMPLAQQMLPTDPRELDQILTQGATKLLQLVSDPGSHEHAPPVGLAFAMVPDESGSAA